MAYELCRPNQQRLGDLSSIISDVRNAITGVVGAALHGTVVQVPLPGGGTASYDVTNPAALAQLQQTIAGIRITRAPAAPAPGGRPMSFVDSIPGGWLTVGAVLVGGILLLRRERVAKA